MSKHEEIHKLLAFVGDLDPQGYLTRMLDNILVNHIIGQIESDFGFIDYQAIADYKALQKGKV